MALAVLLAAGVAWAATIDCVNGEDFRIETDELDAIKAARRRTKITGWTVTTGCWAMAATTAFTLATTVTP